MSKVFCLFVFANYKALYKCKERWQDSGRGRGDEQPRSFSGLRQMLPLKPGPLGPLSIRHSPVPWYDLHGSIFLFCHTVVTFVFANPQVWTIWSWQHEWLWSSKAHCWERSSWLTDLTTQTRTCYNPQCVCVPGWTRHFIMEFFCVWKKVSD